MTRGSDEASQFLRQLIELMLWVFHKERRPGLLGRAIEVLGTVKDGSTARLVRDGDGWSFVKEGHDPLPLPDEKAALEVVPNQGFEATEGVVVPDVAPLLFHGAVKAAEASLHECNVALAVAVRANPQIEGFVSPDLIAQTLTIPLADPVTTSLGMALSTKPYATRSPLWRSRWRRSMLSSTCGQMSGVVSRTKNRDPHS